MSLTQADKTDAIINAFYDVYNELGYGFIENVYQNALYRELLRRDIPCVAHPKINVYYKDEVVGYYEADIIVYNSVFSHYYRERLQNNSESASSALSVSKK